MRRTQTPANMLSSFFTIATAASSSLLVPLVAAHGYPTQIGFSSNLVDTWLPFTDPYESPVPSKPTRKFLEDGPVTDVSSNAIICNTNGGTEDVPVSTVVKGVAAGEIFIFYWTPWLSDHLGPVMTYMASCNGDCTTFNGSSGSWFKIDEAGYSDGVWASTKLINDNSTWTVTIPSTLKAGEYLIRHEILALHSASAENGAQFYPSCNQISVTGSGTLEPEGVTFPGAYSATDPGILIDIWDGVSDYQIPGPAVISASSSTSGPGTIISTFDAAAATTAAIKAADDATATAVTRTSATAASTGKCRRGRRSLNGPRRRHARNTEPHN